MNFTFDVNGGSGSGGGGGPYLPLAGGTMTGALYLFGGPTTSLEAATKLYVDQLVAGLNPAPPVDAATVGNVICSYNNGSSGVGATLTVTGTGTVTFDGVLTVLNGNYLFKNQTDPVENGIYRCSTAGATGVSGVFTRATTYDTVAEINATGVIPVVGGNTLANQGFYQIEVVTTIGTSPLNFAKFGNTGTVSQVNTGTGLTGGPITSVGTIAFAPVFDFSILANISGSSAAPIPNTLTDIFDAILGTTEGSIIYRNAATWVTLDPGVDGQFLKTQGPDAHPIWDESSGSLGFNGYQIFVSATEGNDANSGSYGSPLETIGAAQALGVTLTVNYTINIIDSTNYSGSITISDPRNTAFIGRTAIFTSPDGDVFTVSSSGSQHFIDVGVVQRSSSSNAVKVTGTSPLLLNCGAILGPLETANALLFFTANNLNGTATVTGSGGIAGQCAVRTGSNTGSNIDIISSSGSSSSSFSVNDLISNGIEYPVSDGEYGYVMTTNGEGELFFAPVGASESFQYEDTFWLAKNGNDANNGRSIDNPKLTLDSALAARTTETTPTVINIVDNGTYETAQVFSTGEFVTINGSAATITSSIPDTNAFSIDVGAKVVLICSRLLNNTSGNIVELFGGELFTEVDEIIADISGDGVWTGSFESMTGNIIMDEGFARLRFGILDGAIMGSGTAAFNVSGNTATENWTFEDTSTVFAHIEKVPADFQVVNTGTGLVSCIFGIGLGQNLMNGPLFQHTVRVINVTTPFTPQPTESGALFRYDDTVNDFCVLVSYGTDPTIPVGYFFYVQQKQAGNIQFLSSDVIESVSNRDWTEGRGAVVRVDNMGTFDDEGTTKYIWALSGQIAGSAIYGSGVNVYVSKLKGDDATAIGSLTQPFQSIGAAYAALAASTPSDITNVVINDDEEYDEELDFTYPGINLIGPTASLTASAGDTLTISTTGNLIINLRSLSNSGANNSLTIASAANLFVNVDEIPSGDILQSSTGTAYIRASTITADIECDAAGTVIWGATTRTGADTAGPGEIQGISATGTSNGFDVRGELSVNGEYTFATTDGDAGQVQATDGAGGLTWVDVGGGSASAPGTFYVSQLIGSDSTGDGTFGNPFASNTFAITTAAALAPDVYSIETIDSETYVENLAVTTTNIKSINGVRAKLVPSSGAAFTLGINTPVNIEFLQIAGDVTITTNGTIFATTNELYGNVTANDGGIILDVGLFGAGGIDGGTTGGFVSGFIAFVLAGFGPYVNNTQIMTGYGPLLPLMSMGQPGVTGWYVMPTADGTSGQKIQTDGSHVTSFQTV